MISKVKQDKIYIIELTEDELIKLQHIVLKYDEIFVRSLSKSFINKINNYMKNKITIELTEDEFINMQTIFKKYLSVFYKDDLRFKILIDKIISFKN